MTKLFYKPVGLVLGTAAGLVAGFVFKHVWRALSGEDVAPGPTDEDRDWVEILLAAALQGAIFAVVKAAVDRGGLEGARRLTGRWPA